MAFNDRLKESRTNAGLTQEQLSEKLGIAKSTLSGYESGNREPSIATVAKMLDILDVDANYLYQDEVEKITNVVVNIGEKTILEKYRKLDEDGKQLIDTVLDFEFKRSINLKEARESQKKRLRTYEELLKNSHGTKSQPLKVAENHTYEANAANKRTDIVTPEGTDTSDDDIMDDENF